MRTSLDHERELGFPGLRVLGVDEVGRGCLAGVVTAGAVLLPSESAIDSRQFAFLLDITDSKKLTPERRMDLSPRISRWLEENGGAWALGEASVEEIDRVNIYHAAHLAMTRAVDACLEEKSKTVGILIDGNALPTGLQRRGFKLQAIVKGDLQCLSIACASILAKVHRDAQIAAFDRLYPGYGFASHKGYSTPEHKEALFRLGPTPIHRRSFAPVQRSKSAPLARQL